MFGGQISLLSGCHKAKELDASFLGDSGGINDGFHSRDYHNFYEKLNSTSTYGVLNTQECILGSSNALLARFYSQDYHNFYKKLSLNSRALHTRKQDYLVVSQIGSSTFDCIGKRYNATDLLKCARPFILRLMWIRM